MIVHPHFSHIIIIFYCVSILLLKVGKVDASVAGQETLIGVVGHDFVMLGADSSASSSISLTSCNLDKIFVLVDPFLSNSQETNNVDEERKYEELNKNVMRRQQTIACAAAGNAADADRLLGILQAHTTIREFESSTGCDVVKVFDGSRRKGDNFKESSYDTLGFNDYSEMDVGLDTEAIAHCARREISSALRSPSPYRVCLLVAGVTPILIPKKSAQNQKLHPFNANKEIPSSHNNIAFSRRIQQQIELSGDKVQMNKIQNNKNLINKSPYEEEEIVDEDENNALEKTGGLNVLPPTNFSLLPQLIWIDEYGSIQSLNYGAHGYGANFALSILDQGYRPHMTRSEALKLIKDCFSQLRSRYVINSPQPPCIKCIDSNGCELMS